MTEISSELGNVEEVCSFKTKRSKFALENSRHAQRICFLLKAAELFAQDNPNLSRTYIKELKEISEKHLIRLSAACKRKFCSGCNTVLIPGKTALVKNLDDINVVLKGTSQNSGGMPLVEAPRWICVICMTCTRSRRYVTSN